MENNETLLRAYGIAASLLRHDLRTGVVAGVCRQNRYSPQETQAIESAMTQIADDLSALMLVHIRAQSKEGSKQICTDHEPTKS